MSPIRHACRASTAATSHAPAANRTCRASAGPCRASPHAAMRVFATTSIVLSRSVATALPAAPLGDRATGPVEVSHCQRAATTQSYRRTIVSTEHSRQWRMRSTLWQHSQLTLQPLVCCGASRVPVQMWEAHRRARPSEPEAARCAARRPAARVLAAACAGRAARRILPQQPLRSFYRSIATASHRRLYFLATDLLDGALVAAECKRDRLAHNCCGHADCRRSRDVLCTKQHNRMEHTTIAEAAHEINAEAAHDRHRACSCRRAMSVVHAHEWAACADRLYAPLSGRGRVRASAARERASRQTRIRST